MLRKARFDEGLARLGLTWTDRRGRKRSYADVAGTVVFYLIIALVILGVLEVLDLPMLAGPLDEEGARAIVEQRGIGRS